MRFVCSPLWLQPSCAVYPTNGRGAVSQSQDARVLPLIGVTTLEPDVYGHSQELQKVVYEVAAMNGASGGDTYPPGKSCCQAVPPNPKWARVRPTESSWLSDNDQVHGYPAMDSG
jgi:hypothetical protein